MRAYLIIVIGVAEIRTPTDSKKQGRSPVELRRAWCNVTCTLWRNCARSGQAAGGTPLLESFDVRVGEQKRVTRNVGLARLVEHEAQDVLDLGLATAFDVTQHRRRVL